MKCINENHDHEETIMGHVKTMECSHCGDNLHYDSGVSDYVHDNQEHSCWLHSRPYVLIGAPATPCMFNVQEILDSVLPEAVADHPDWTRATAQETSDLLNNLRDEFSDFWGVRV